jgi:NaMN:DMB phosphoribosyltransferase
MSTHTLLLVFGARESTSAVPIKPVPNNTSPVIIKFFVPLL